jgi:hypothetical protein
MLDSRMHILFPHLRRYMPERDRKCYRRRIPISSYSPIDSKITCHTASSFCGPRTSKLSAVVDVDKRCDCESYYYTNMTPIDDEVDDENTEQSQPRHGRDFDAKDNARQDHKKRATEFPYDLISRTKSGSEKGFKSREWDHVM